MRWVRSTPYYLVMLTWLAAGCGPANNRVAVEGIVTLDGKPIKGVSLTFMPRGKGRPGIGETDVNGRFRMKDVGIHDGLPPGDYDVLVMLAEWSKLKTVEIPIGAVGGDGAETMEIVEVAPHVTKWIVPERYSKLGASGLSASIRSATTDLSLALTVKP